MLTTCLLTGGYYIPPITSALSKDDCRIIKAVLELADQYHPDINIINNIDVNEKKLNEEYVAITRGDIRNYNADDVISIINSTIEYSLTDLFIDSIYPVSLQANPYDTCYIHGVFNEFPWHPKVHKLVIQIVSKMNIDNITTIKEKVEELYRNDDAKNKLQELDLLYTNTLQVKDRESVIKKLVNELQEILNSTDKTVGGGSGYKQVPITPPIPPQIPVSDFKLRNLPVNLLEPSIFDLLSKYTPRQTETEFKSEDNELAIFQLMNYLIPPKHYNSTLQTNLKGAIKGLKEKNNQDIIETIIKLKKNGYNHNTLTQKGGGVWYNSDDNKENVRNNSGKITDYEEEALIGEANLLLRNAIQKGNLYYVLAALRIGANPHRHGVLNPGGSGNLNKKEAITVQAMSDSEKSSYPIIRHPFVNLDKPINVNIPMPTYAIYIYHNLPKTDQEKYPLFDILKHY